MDLLLPYKVGDLAECRTFNEGYRGAWFRCKIHDMRVAESGYLECYLEYIDYPGEKKEWIILFQKNPACSKQQSSDQIMIRPSFPQWYWQNQAPEQIPDNDVVAIVRESWGVGDMVDWFSEGCYWSGKVTKLLNEDMLQVQLHKPPTGEGQRYAANRNDLRPTLDWALLTGWTVPESQAKGKVWRVADLVHHKSTESESSDSEHETSPDGDKADNGGDGGDSQDVQLQDDGDKGDSGGDGGDIQNVQNAPGSRIPEPSSAKKSIQDVQKAPGSPIPEPSSTENSTSRLEAQDDATLVMSMTDLGPSSPSKSGSPSDSVQPAVTSSQSGTEIIEQERDMESSNKHEQAVGVLGQYEQGLLTVDSLLEELQNHEERLAGVGRRLEDIEERKRSMDCRAARLRSFRCALGDASATTSDLEDSVPVSEPA